MTIIPNQNKSQRKLKINIIKKKFKYLMEKKKKKKKFNMKKWLKDMRKKK